jgi:hypothetical protein
MPTKEEALKNLNLPSTATEEEINKAYQRMVRRYPPEFHPDRFRQIDESYRTLTSLAFLAESIFTVRTDVSDADLAGILADLSLAAREDAVEKSSKEIRTLLYSDALWPGSRGTV